MFNGSSAFGDWNGNSFADPSMHVDTLIHAVSTWKFGVSQAAAMRGTGVV